MKNIYLPPLLLALLFCIACQSKYASGISVGAEIVALRGEAYYQGRVSENDSSGLLVRWNDGAPAQRYSASEIALLPGEKRNISIGKFGLCGSKEGRRWRICRVETVSADTMTVILLEKNSIVSISAEDFVVPSEGQREEFVRRSTALLRESRNSLQDINAVNPPVGMNLPLLPNMIVLLHKSDGEFIRGICGRIDGDTVYVAPFHAQYTISATPSEVAPVYGMEFEREAYRKNLKVGDIIYASPDGMRFLPARVESILEEGRIIKVVFSDGFSMDLSEEYWLPQEKNQAKSTDQ